MDKFWLEKAKKYLEEHNAFEDVSDISYVDSSSIALISANALVNLPSSFISKGITDLGVRNKEEILFIFTEQFPLVTPKILLRDDFPRCFPHINPSYEKVSPCIYEGNLSELLQQSEWLNGILNQLIDWLEKAASNELLNYDQGWEAMRNDNFSGFMLYDINEVLKAFQDIGNILDRKIIYEERNNLIFTDGLCVGNGNKAHALYYLSPYIIDSYAPNPITTLSDLYEYVNSIGISRFKDNIEKIDMQYLTDEDSIFVVLSIKRPINLIGSNIDVEFLNFMIHKSKNRKKKKRVLPDCKVEMLTHIQDRSPNLLKYISGTQTKINESKKIAILGCGSLGSKIGIHLARNGNGPFLCIDDDWFLPHNNARHALTFPYPGNKSDLLSSAIWAINNMQTFEENQSAINIDYKNVRLIIDTTASLVVRNFLMSEGRLAPVISGALYGQGRYGLLLFESKAKTVTLMDIWAYLYRKSLENETIKNLLFSSNLEKINIGQSCSSQTLIVDDSRISLIAASMSLKIQQVLEADLVDKGEILFLKYNEDYSLSSEVFDVTPNIVIPSDGTNEFKVLLTESAFSHMKQSMQEKAPNETGGVLIGTVFLHSKTIIVTDILLAPPDSVEEPGRFILGTEGLEKRIRDIEKSTNGKVTYLGTWHSHPHGGGASSIDLNTFKKLLFIRNYEPTVCIILTPEKLLLV